MKNFDDVQKLGRDNLDATLKSMSAMSRNLHTITSEIADCSKKSIEESSKAMEKMWGSEVFQHAIETQTAFAMTACETVWSGAAKMGGLYANLIMEACKPFESNLTNSEIKRVA